MGIVEQDREDIAGVIRNWKDALAPLNFCRQANEGKKLNGFFDAKLMEGAVEKFAIFAKSGNKVFQLFFEDLRFFRVG